MKRNQHGPDYKSRRDAAIDWLSRIKAATLTRAERDAFEAWLAADEANRTAFDESTALWKELKGVSVPSDAADAAPAKRRPWPLAVASLAIILVLVFASGDLAILWQADFATGTGEVKTVILEDGSRIELNADTAIAKHYSGRQRYLTLLKGEAWFEVAKDPARPFVVEAAAGQTMATGTSFNIAMTGTGTQVTVSEHSVVVAATGQTVAVEAGQQVSYGPDHPVLAARPADAGNETAWRRGFLIFQDKPLSEVIAAIDRYHHGYCLIIDPSIRSRRVSGVFHTSEPLESIRTIELSLGLRAAYLGDYLILLHR